MKFKTARNIVCVLYTAATIILIAGITSFASGTFLRTATIIAGVVLILLGAGIRMNYLNCPKCGEHITGKLLDTVKCPKCGAELMPKKQKNSKK